MTLNGVMAFLHYFGRFWGLLQFIHKLRNFMHIISMQSRAAAITLSGSFSGSRYASGYPATSGCGRILEIGIRHISSRHALLAYCDALI